MSIHVQSMEPYIMKPHKILFLALIVSAAFAVSAQAGDRHRRNGNAPTRGSSSAHYSGPATHSAGPAIHSGSNFRYGGSRTFAPSPRMTMRSTPQFSQHHVVSGGNGAVVPHQFTPRTFSSGTHNGLAQFQHSRPIQTNRFGQMQGHRGDGIAQLQGQHGNRFAQRETGRGNRTVGNISPGHNHVFAQHSGEWHRDWDHNHDHWWNGHRCRWVNNSWFIFDIGFFPWFGWPYSDYYAYNYYPYGYPYGYGYPSGYEYDSGAYYGSSYYDQNGYDSSYYDQGGYDSSYNGQGGYGSYDRSAAALVAYGQALLEREGYYRGQIHGGLGPERRHTIVRYQSDRGLEPSGNRTTETLRWRGVHEHGALY